MVKIFTGPLLIAKAIVSELLENGIKPVERNDYNSGLITGFATLTRQEVTLLVREDQALLSKDIVSRFKED